ncbi:hypothetical protein ACFC09_15365 [Streptomyces sp. NPDC056161]|uniref:hypothetical protein n=1 Tax=Streptomyces sp. NPDC056161 TaxID=3345732 RepID=UPI0035E15C51
MTGEDTVAELHRECRQDYKDAASAREAFKAHPDLIARGDDSAARSTGGSL